MKLYEESINEIKSGEANINVQEVKALYEEATKYIPNLQKTFDEALTFHKNLISNKVNFISADIPKIKENIEKLTKDWHAELETEKKIVEKQKKEGSLADYELIVSQLNGKYEEKGKLSEELEKLSDLEQSLKDSLDNIDKLNENIEKFDEFLQKGNHGI